MRNTLIIFLFSMLAFTVSCGNNDKTQKAPDTGENVEEVSGQSDQKENEDASENNNAGEKVMILISTNKGDIKIELDKGNAPITVDNFLSYAEEGFYNNTIFHRVIPNFMIQGGGFNEDMSQKETKDPIKNEAENGLANDRGTVAMARTSVVDSATSQFFINLNDNTFLNNGVRDFGYAVFGKVVEGMEIIDQIGAMETGTVGPYRDVPKEPVIIESVKKIEQ